MHPTAIEILRAPLVHDDEPRPRIETHGDYIIGILLVAVAIKTEDRVFYQEVDFVLTPDAFVTVSKTRSRNGGPGRSGSGCRIFATTCSASAARSRRPATPCARSWTTASSSTTSTSSRAPSSSTSPTPTTS